MCTVHWGNKPRWGAAGHSSGFTLPETVVAVAVTMTLLAATIPVSLRLVAKARLSETAQRLAWTLRCEQAVAQTNGGHGLVEMSTYTPDYFVYEDSRLIQKDHFEDGVAYKDGYLQMSARRIGYNPYGDCAVGGVIELVSAGDAETIRLFMGTGLQEVEAVQ